MATSYQNVPPDAPEATITGALSWIRRAAVVLNNVLRGKLNAIYNSAGSDFTLAAGAASTALTDARLSINSHVTFTPLTANAAAEQGNGTMYVLAANMNSGLWTISHANNAQTDRTFRVLIIGAIILCCILRATAPIV